ncbi:MAG TPA: Ig-like domain repeat protein [Candidatus Sulfotelmatobacter sp.]|nr:Ig-like domain repeat protein [Candidatus Sulfotelmatobacter sp.]
MNPSKMLAALLWLCPLISLSAQTTNVWDGGGADNNWTTPANWSGGEPVNGDGLAFSGAVRQINTNDISGLANLNTVTFTTAGWNVEGNAVSTTNDFIESAAGSNTWGLATTLNNSTVIYQSSAGDVLNFTGVLSGSGGLSTVAGSGGVGMLFLSNPNNSFTGNVSISSATAVIYSLSNAGQNSSLGAGSGTVTVGSTATSYEGSLIYAGTNSCVTARPFQWEARTTGSPVFCNNSPNNSNLTFNGGWTTVGDLDPFTVVLEGSSTGTNTFNGSIAQSSPFTVSVQVAGSGTWVFAANNTYRGTTTINDGVLQLGGGGTTGDAGPAATNSIIFASGGTLAIDRSDSPVFANAMTVGGTDTISVAAGKTATLGGVISGSGALVDNSPDATLTFTNADTYTGSTTVSAGKLALSANGSISNSSAVNISGGAVFDVSGLNNAFSLGANQTLGGTGATGTINGNVSMGAGSLELAFTPGTPTLTITGGALTMNNNAVSVAVSGNATLPPGTYELISPGAGGSVNGSVSSSPVLLNGADNQPVSLQITNDGLYLVVSPSTASIPTITSICSSMNPSAYGTAPVTFTATVSPAPTNGESVFFMDATNLLAGAGLTNGSAAFSTSALSIGNHVITVSYDGDALYMASESSALTQTVNQVAICYPQGTAFPLFMYEIDDSTYPTLEQYGWNIMQEYGLVTNSDVNGFLEGLLSNNVDGPAIIPCSGASDPYTAWPQTQVQSWVQSIASNTNLAWWSLPEEMLPWYSSETNILADYTAWTRLYDPRQRPTYEYVENSFAETNFAAVIPYVDVIGVSCYCEELGMPHAWVRYKLQQAAQGVALAGKTIGSNYPGGQKTLMAILSIAQFTNNSPSEPSPSQTYHDFWSAVASGAQGIGVWSCYHALNDDPSNLTNNLNELNLAASQITGPANIGQAILYGVLNSNVTFNVTSGPTNTVSFTPPEQTSSFQYPSINVLSKTWNGYVYVIAVNSTSNAVTATISNIPSPMTSVTLPFESRSVSMTNGSFSDSFAAWGVHIYKIPSALTAPALNSSTSCGDDSFTFSFSGANAQSYRVLASTNLLLPLTNWLVLSRGTFGVNLVYFTDNAAANISRFYRIASP